MEAKTKKNIGKSSKKMNLKRKNRSQK